MQHPVPGILLTIGLLAVASRVDSFALEHSEWAIETKALWTESAILFPDSAQASNRLNLEILPDPFSNSVWVVQDYALYIKNRRELRRIALPENLATRQITAAATTREGSLMIAIDNQLWNLEISDSQEFQWTQPFPELPAGFRCLDLFQSRDGLFWARSHEVLFQLDSHDEPLAWRLISGAPLCVATQNGTRHGMGEDSNGRFWVVGFKGAQVGFWFWESEMQNWKETPLPVRHRADGIQMKSVFRQEVPLIASNSSAKSDPVLLWEGSIYQWTDGVWLYLGAGSWDSPSMATLSGNQKVLWVWDQGESGILVRKDLNSGEVENQSFGHRFAQGSPTILVPMFSSEELYLGDNHSLTEIRPNSGAVFSWGTSHRKVEPETLQRTGSSTWVAIADNKKELVEFSWTHSVPETDGSLKMRSLLHWSSEDIRLNTFLYWAGNYWLGTNRGLVIYSEDAVVNDAKYNSATSMPPIPGSRSKFDLKRPEGIESESTLISGALLKLGVIPEAGIWALTNEEKLVWIWTQPDLEHPGWKESISPWNWGRDTFVKAISPTRAWVIASGKWWLVEARYSFVAEDWAWSRTPVNSKMDWNSVPDHLELLDEGWIWADARGLGRLALDGSSMDWHRWQNTDPRLAWAEDRMTCFTLKSWERPQGWIFIGEQLHAFDGTNVLQKGQIIGESVGNRTFLDAFSSKQPTGDHRHQILILAQDRLLSCSWVTSLSESFEETAWIHPEKDEPADPPHFEHQTVDQVQSVDNSSVMLGLSLIGLMAGGAMFYYLRRWNTKESGGLLKAARLKKRQIEKERTPDESEQRMVSDMDQAIPSHEADEEIYWSVLGHELRTPLNAILGYAEMMEEEVKYTEDPLQRRDLARIIMATRREMTLIRAALDYTAGERRSIKKLSGSLTRTAIQKSVTRAINNVASISFNKKCEIQFHPAVPSEESVEMSQQEVEAPVELSRAIEYFLEACLHADPGGKFQFEVSDKGKALFPMKGETTKNSVVKNPIIRISGCCWPESVESLKQWLAESDPWKALLTQIIPGQAEMGPDGKRTGAKETPLWKVCLALCQTLARRMGGCLEIHSNSAADEKNPYPEMHIRFSQ